MGKLLEVNNLSVSFDAPVGEIEALRDVSFSLEAGEVLAIVGESGCGKSVLCKTIMKLLPKTAWIKSGSILVDGTDITGYPERDMQKLRGRLFSMVFQDPMTALNPTIPIGRQIAEAVLVHDRKLPAQEVRRRVLQLMELVDIQRPEERYGLYPYNFSGGMRQRAVMAIALASNPRILFADEPTTALDVTIQAQILDLLREVQAKLGTATVLVSHDLGVVARVADRVAVMYAGKIVEIGTADEIFFEPHHPYTTGLLACVNNPEEDDKELHPIPGSPPDLLAPPAGCPFVDRCSCAMRICKDYMPEMTELSGTHKCACWLEQKKEALA